MLVTLFVQPPAFQAVIQAGVKIDETPPHTLFPDRARHYSALWIATIPQTKPNEKYN